jgi:hypothetical protein
MDFLLIAYVLVTLVLISGTFYINYSSGKTITAAFLGIGTLAAAIFFGIRWFPGGELVTKSIQGPWPPSINVCPDFLTLTKVNGTPVCIDPLGVSRRENNGGMNQWKDATQTDPSFTFSLHTDKQGNARLTALYAECKSKGVSWEGVYDGTVGLGRQPPLPPA